MNTGQQPSRAVAQAGNVTFELHTLGWEAFQNLCGHIAREILGQSVTTFSPGNDAGQDGAFQGTWQKSKEEVFLGRFVIQCKFTSRRDEHLGLGDLKEELVKVERLAGRGLAQTYLLMSNAKVSGEAYIAIREAFLNIKGIEYFELYGLEWITQQIIESKRLRALVPRIYGLGDLSQILDERVYEQTNEILQTWRDNLAKFVPTEAHYKGVKALFDEGFVLLLGDPMAGKSTIAAALAIAAADQSKCIPVFATHPDDFEKHWNPNEPNQFFWVDDAFGQTQFDPALAEGWSRLFPYLTAAIRKGTRILFTSRNYIYEAAKRALKESSFPLIRSSHVIIEVENLKLQEKERILYNHLRLGGQPSEFRKAVKPFLSLIAASPKFFPEVARRLGDPFFTKSLKINEEHLKKFLEEPVEFLGEIIDRLDHRSFAALALLFMRAGRAAMPLEIGAEETNAMNQLGANLAQLREALATLSGSLVSRAFESSEQLWKFRHPSIRDAMAAHVAAKPDLIDIYLGGVKATELLNEVVCGNIEFGGAKVHVPSNRFTTVAAKLLGLDVTHWDLRYKLLFFLTSRCSPEFCAVWFAECREDFERLCQHRFVWSYQYCVFLMRLHRLGCLPEERRRQFVQEAIQRAVETAESMVLCDDGIRELFTRDELESALHRVRSELPPALESIIDEIATEYDDTNEEPSEHFQQFETRLEEFRDYFEELNDAEMVEAFEGGQELAQEGVARLEEWRSEKEKKAEQEREQVEREEERRAEEEMFEAMIDEYERGGMHVSSPKAQPTFKTFFSKPAPPRSIFDDVDL
jgi:hypothetical protein